MISNTMKGSRATLLSLALLLFLGACSEPDIQLTLPFAASFGQDPIDCERAIGPLQMTDLRLYVSDLYLLNGAGERTKITLLADERWQQSDLALIDLENGNGACDNGTNSMHDVLLGSVPAGNYHGLIFEIGVPFNRNHSDPLLAVPPLGDTAMHWSWRGGYKFLRAGVRTATDGFWVHLGSTGCQGKINDITGCSSANRVTVTLPNFEPGNHGVVIDLAELFATIDLRDSEPGDCSSGPAETHCAGVFDALGLDFATGAATGQQRVFVSRALN